MDDEIPLLRECVTQCPNPLCSDYGIDRPVVVDVDSWWCWCTSPMQPPKCARAEQLEAWKVASGLDIHDYGNCGGMYHGPELPIYIEGPAS